MALPTANYPASLIGSPGEINTGKDNSKTFENITAADKTIPGDHLNTMAVELEAVQTELGTDPAGSVTDVKTRLAVSLAGDGSLDATDKVAFDGTISPSQITGSQNNYSPTNWDTSNTVRLDSDAAYDITGFDAGDSGQMKMVHNIGSYTLTLKNESASSSAANRLDLNDDVQLKSKQMIVMQYDNTSSRWRVISGGVSAAAAGLPNMCLNPGFETVLPGSHSAFFTQVVQVEGTGKTVFPGWQAVAPGTSGNITTTEETSTVTGQSGTSAKIVTGTNTGTDPRLEQVWNSSEYIIGFVYAYRGKEMPLSADVKQAAADSNSCRLFITYNGTGGTTEYSDYHGANTDWERLFKTVTIPTDCTEIKFGLELYDDAKTYYIDNVMTRPDDESLSSLAYEPRPPISMISDILDTLNNFQYTTPADTNFHVTGDSTADTDIDYDDIRPIWATGINVLLINGSSSAAATVKPNGFTNRWNSVSASADNVPDDIPLAEDGQFQYSLGATSSATLYIDHRYWYGEGL